MKNLAYSINCCFIFKHVYIVMIMLFCLSGGALGLTKDMKIKDVFDKKYEEWIHEVKLDSVFNTNIRNDGLIVNLQDNASSSPSYYTGNDKFNGIILLGPKVLEFIADKIENGGSVERAYMRTAFLRITKARIVIEEYYHSNLDKPEKDVLLWWKHGRFQTDTSIKEYYVPGKIKRSNSEYFESFCKFGIPALPFAIEKIKEGDVDLIEAVNYWTDDALKKSAEEKMIPAESMREYCIQWWEENKENWLLPPLEDKEQQ